MAPKGSIFQIFGRKTLIEIHLLHIDSEQSSSHTRLARMGEKQEAWDRLLSNVWDTKNER
jgi:hypothetical protein